MEDTWFSRDLPVLDAAVELLQKQDFVAVKDITVATGIETEDVARSLLDMRYEFVSEINSMGQQEDWDISGVSAAARRAVGQWPTPENLVERLAAGLSAAAENEADSERSGKLRAVAGFIGDAGKDLTAEIIAKLLARQMGMPS